MRKLIVLFNCLLACFVKLHQIGYELSQKKKKLMTNMTEVKGVQYCVCDSVKSKETSLGVHCSYHSVIYQTSHLTALKVFYLFVKG